MKPYLLLRVPWKLQRPLGRVIITGKGTYDWVAVGVRPVAELAGIYEYKLVRVPRGKLYAIK